MSSERLLRKGKKHVVIVGAGAAGMACAATLAEQPDKFKVTVLERMSYAGGQATSIPLDKSKYGTNWMNDGVQGGSVVFKHTFNFFHLYNYQEQDIKLQVSFGKGKDQFWTNVFPTQLVDQHQADIKKFGRVLKLIKYTMPVLGIVPIRVMLKMFFFNKDFGDKMVLPLIALFLGTGNQTPNVCCAVLERLFHDPNMALWNYDPKTLLPNLPQMVTFPNLNNFYADWVSDLRSKGVDIRLSTDVSAVLSRDDKGIVLQTRPFDPSQNDGLGGGAHTGPPAVTETFDEMVLAMLADDAKKLLGQTATRREKFVLGGARFYDDITITHCDHEYFQKHYETHFNADLCGVPKTEEDKRRIAFAKGEIKTNDKNEASGFRPMYYTKTYPEDPQKIEMSFDVTNYQHQFRMDHGLEIPPVKYENHIFQSIFLDKRNRHLWTIDEIDKDKIIESKWWHQLGHRWQHYVKVVPGMMFINGRNHTCFAGAWTLVNMHEMACVSGIAAAYRLGAEYRKFDDFAEDLFKKYLLVSHGVIYKKGKKFQ
ncbi:MAG: hypothetical protein M1823_004100 [Watsoniomyces obsoletus]|nr:MAG: hypothetical protein M1823_004100 [Watsoniomyces obsoletus]